MDTPAGSQTVAGDIVAQIALYLTGATWYLQRDLGRQCYVLASTSSEDGHPFYIYLLRLSEEPPEKEIRSVQLLNIDVLEPAITAARNDPTQVQLDLSVVMMDGQEIPATTQMSNLPHEWQENIFSSLLLQMAS